MDQNTDNRVEPAFSSESPTGIMASPGSSPIKRFLKRSGWIAIGFFALGVFTLLKLPEERLKNYIEGSIAASLSSYGVSVTTEKAKLSIIFGPSYVMKDVTVSLPPPATPVKYDEVVLSPSMWSLLFGKIGGDFRINQGDARLKGTFLMKGSAKNSDFDLSFDAKKVDIGKSGLLQLASGMQGSGRISGSGKLSGNFNTPSTWTGETDLNLEKLSLEQQSVSGFTLPQLRLSDAKIKLKFDRSKAIIETLKLGRPGSQDDLIATVSGDVQLGRQLQSSVLNLSAKFSLSQNVIKSLVLIDALLGPGKLPDGSYSYTVSGPVYSPVPTPAK